MDKDRVLTVAIVMGMFGGLVGGPSASLVYYDSAPEERFYLFIIPEIVGFICAGLMVYFGKLKKKPNH
jgi:tetrahydromethanopterin S-methyltransferase subunit D